MSEYTLEGMGGGLEDPASLWPELPELEEESASYGWVWAAMTPAERRAKMRELAEWVQWLRTTFELHNQIPACWYRHPPVREHLTALYAGWVRTYCQPAPGRDLAEAEWLSTLHGFLPRLQVASCANGTHHEAPPRPAVRPEAQEEFEDFLTVSEFGTAESAHPAEAEALRQATEL
ncbi:hypothetical protein ACFYMO_31455 [Streptomyces sp. NPDC007025]|uniref:hypothetical protein n=1 Tax=Streptomyces sp. NPDC007025 TaxID=3364771 RepID=UPI00368D327F